MADPYTEFLQSNLGYPGTSGTYYWPGGGGIEGGNVFSTGTRYLDPSYSLNPQAYSLENPNAPFVALAMGPNSPYQYGQYIPLSTGQMGRIVDYGPGVKNFDVVSSQYYGGGPPIYTGAVSQGSPVFSTGSGPAPPGMGTQDPTMPTMPSGQAAPAYYTPPNLSPFQRTIGLIGNLAGAANRAMGGTMGNVMGPPAQSGYYGLGYQGLNPYSYFNPYLYGQR